MRLDLLADAVRSADRVTECRDRHLGLALTVETAPEGGDPLEKQRVAVPRMADRARQILHDILDQPGGSAPPQHPRDRRPAPQPKRRPTARRPPPPRRPPPRAGLRRQRLVETCR